MADTLQHSEAVEKQKKQDVFSSFGFYSVPELSQEERKPPEYLVDGMIEVGLNVISGKPKLRKSFLAVQLAIAVASGQEFFGHKTVQCDVCYLDLEGSKSRISTRTKNLTTEIPRNLFFTNSVKEKLSNGLIDKLRLLHRQRPTIRLIIIDTFSQARGRPKAIGQNAYDADVDFLGPVQRMAVDENIAILFVTHDRKGGGAVDDPFERVSGSTGITGTADSVINLSAVGKRFEGKALLEYNSRDAKGGEFNIFFDERYLEWQRYEEQTPDARSNAVCKWIIDNTPEPRREGVFFPYETVCKGAYQCWIENPGDKVREQIKVFKDELATVYNIGIQTGVKSNGVRGIRLFNTL